MHPSKLLAIGAVVVSLLASGASAHDVTLTFTLDSPGDGGYYKLTGQNAYIQHRTSSGTGGNQGLGVTTPGTVLNYQEVFPEASLADYLTFFYFGTIETYDINDQIVDTSLVIGFLAGEGVGTTVPALFPDFTEAQLVAALTGSEDSAEYVAFREDVENSSLTGAAITTIPGNAGETLYLVAYLTPAGGNDEGAVIGSLTTVITPEPASLALVAVGGLAMLRRRR